MRKVKIMTLGEEWRDVAGYKGLYKVSSSGDVYSIKRGIIRKPQTNRLGYQMISLCKNGVV